MRTRTLGRVLGAGVLAASGAIHLDLYLTGYRQIHVIGVLFLLQIIGAFALVATLLGTLRVADGPAGRLAALAGAAFAAGTFVGYFVSLHHGMFGFREIASGAGTATTVLEILALVLLLPLATPRERPRLGFVVAPFAVAVIALALVPAPGSAAATLTTSTASGAAQSGATAKIIIKDFAFHPMVLTVTPGERIRVTNEDSVTHTFTATKPTEFNTGNVGPGQTKTITAPTKPGRYSFLCAIHQYMTGTLTVK